MFNKLFGKEGSEFVLKCFCSKLIVFPTIGEILEVLVLVNCKVFGSQQYFLIFLDILVIHWLSKIERPAFIMWLDISNE